jgi:hypothetical protein
VNLLTLGLERTPFLGTVPATYAADIHTPANSCGEKLIQAALVKNIPPSQAESLDEHNKAALSTPIISVTVGVRNGGEPPAVDQQSKISTVLEQPYPGNLTTSTTGASMPHPFVPTAAADSASSPIVKDNRTSIRGSPAG